MSQYRKVDNHPPMEDTEYILYNEEWISVDNPKGTMYGFIQDEVWHVVVWGFNSGKYNTVSGIFTPTHYMEIPQTKYLRS